MKENTVVAFQNPSDFQKDPGDVPPNVEKCEIGIV